MAKTLNLEFDDGIKEYMINNDENRIIRVSTTDYSIISRFEQAEENIKEKMKSFDDIEIKPDGTPAAGTEEAIKIIEDLTQFINDQIDYMFNSKVSEIVFNGQSCLSTSKGVPLYERFINSIVPIIEKDLEAELKESQKRMSKYTTGLDAYKKKNDAK